MYVPKVKFPDMCLEGKLQEISYLRYRDNRIGYIFPEIQPYPIQLCTCTLNIKFPATFLKFTLFRKCHKNLYLISGP